MKLRAQLVSDMILIRQILRWRRRRRRTTMIALSANAIAFRLKTVKAVQMLALGLKDGESFHRVLFATSLALIERAF